jgi:two-component system, OmpR family, phosphate regulon sensor histidine kinase PhoR
VPENKVTGRLLRLTMQNSPVGMTLVALDGGFITANAAFCDMLGYREDELQELGFAQITHPDDLDEDLQLVEDVLAGRINTYRMRKRYLRKSGEPMWAELSVALLRDDDGEPIHFISQILDISEQVVQAERLSQAQQTIDHQRRMAEAVYDSIDIGLVLLDSNGHYESMNRSHGRFLELAYPDGHDGQAGQLGEVYAADGVSALPREEMPTVRATQGEEFDDVRMWVGSDPLTRRCLSVSSRTVLDASGAFAGAALAYKDVTDFMHALEIKDQFVASVSHELRTPLTAVLGHLELLAERPDLPGQAQGQIEVIERNANRLRLLVSDLLSVAQGGMRLSRDRCDLVQIVREALEAARPLADAAGLRVEPTLPDSLVAEVDGDRIRQVMDNLLSNAIKYSPGGGGEVCVRLLVDGNRAVLEVSDTGIGIEASDRDRLFTRFFRARHAEEQSIQGVGLGLSIAKSIVESHGGRIAVDSEIGRGSTFRIRLPLE